MSVTVIARARHYRSQKRRCDSAEPKYRVPTVARYCEKADLADLITVFSATGVRTAEILAFRPEDFDPKTKTITVTGHIVRVPKVGLRRLTNDYDPRWQR